MTFPRFKLNTEEDVSTEVLENRARFATGPMGYRFTGSPVNIAAPVSSFPTAEETAEAFGRDMFARCGKDWPAMIGLATGAAMKAERNAMGDMK